MTPDENKALVRAWFSEIDRGARADFDRFLAAGCCAAESFGDAQWVR